MGMGQAKKPQGDPCSSLANCRQGKLFASINIMNSFFQTHMYPDNVPLTMVNMPWRLYEWVIMPIGIKNTPAIYQQRVINVL
jgi:hypothetical protein